MTTPLLEAIARAMVKGDLFDAEQIQCGFPQAAARAALSAIEKEGYVLMPKEPTKEMLSRAAEAMPIEYEFREMQTGGSVPGFPPATRLVVVGFAKPRDRVSPRGVYAALLASRPKPEGT